MLQALAAAAGRLAGRLAVTYSNIVTAKVGVVQ